MGGVVVEGIDRDMILVRNAIPQRNYGKRIH